MAEDKLILSKLTSDVQGIKGQFKQTANDNNRNIASITKDIARHFSSQKSQIKIVSSNVDEVENTTQKLSSKIDSAVNIINNDLSSDNETLSIVKTISRNVEKLLQDLEDGGSKIGGGGAGGSGGEERPTNNVVLDNIIGGAKKIGIGAGGIAGASLIGGISSKFGGEQKPGEPSDAKGDNQQGDDTGKSSSKGDDKMAKIQTKDGKAVQVHADYASNFEGFINELESTGYKIKSIGGYANRNIAGTGTASWHSKGMAIDINPDANPVTKGEPGRKPKTDMPENVGQIAAKYGLGWGGAWDGEKQDAMHFSLGEGPGAKLRGQREKVGLGKGGGGGASPAAAGGGESPKPTENKGGGSGGTAGGSSVAAAPSDAKKVETPTAAPPAHDHQTSEEEKSASPTTPTSNEEKSASPTTPTSNDAKPADAAPVKKEIPRLADVQERIKKEGTPDTFPGNSGGTFKKNPDGSATLISSKGDKTDFTAEQYEREVAKRTWDKESKAAMSSTAKPTEPVATPVPAASPVSEPVKTTPEDTKPETKTVKKEGGLLTAADIFPGMDPNKPGVKAAVARFQAKQIERDPSLRTSASDFAQLDSVDTKAADAAKIEPAVYSKIAAGAAAAPVPSTPASAPNADVIAQAAVKKETEQPVAPPPKEADTGKSSTTINNNIQQTAANDSNPSLSWSEKVMGYYSLQDQVKMGSAHFSMA